MHVPSLNFALGEDIDLLRESVAAFASHHIAPLAATADQDNVFLPSCGACSVSKACSG